MTSINFAYGELGSSTHMSNDQDYPWFFQGLPPRLRDYAVSEQMRQFSAKCYSRSLCGPIFRGRAPHSTPES